MNKKQRLKLLTELAAAYSLCLSENEDYIWQAYGQRVKDAVLRFTPVNVEPDPGDAEACRKYEKQLRIAIMNLHTEVQQFYAEQQSAY